MSENVVTWPDHPILIVDGDPSDWFSAHPNCLCGEPHAYTHVRINGPLPTVEVWDAEPGHEMWSTRPLRVGDRVTLALPLPGSARTVKLAEPFATATVANIYEVSDRGTLFATVTDVEAL